jgi:uncharacterized membrane protein (UPF0127 family)
MDNATRRQLLDRARSSGFPGSILDVYSAYDQGRDLVQEFIQEQQAASTQPPMQVAQTPQEQQQGLRPAHEAGNTQQSMAFPNVQPGQSFNTVGMKVPIDINKIDNQGNLVESFKAVPPGIQNLPTGPYEGTVIESPAKMQKGGFHQKIYTDPEEFRVANQAYNDSLEVYNAPKTSYARSQEISNLVDSGNFQEAQTLLDTPYPFYNSFRRLTILNNQQPKPVSGYPIYLGLNPSNPLVPKFKKPTEKPVYQERPDVTYIKSKDGRFERELMPIRTTLMPPSNTMRVLRDIQEEDKSNKYMYPTKVVKAPEFQNGGFDIVEPRSTTAVKINPLVRQINFTDAPIELSESSPNFDYQGYYDKANKYLSRPIFKGSTLTAKDIADAAQDFYGKTNYEYPLDLLLTQGQMETKLGKTLKSKHNYFNVGNTDSGATKDFPSAKDSVSNYMNLMYNDYLAKGEKSPEELLKPKGFVNYQGNRYASAPDYEAALAKQKAYISGYINKMQMGGSYQTNQEIASYEWRTGRPEESRKRYIVGGLKNRVLYNKAKYKR